MRIDDNAGTGIPHYLAGETGSLYSLLLMIIRLS